MPEYICTMGPSINSLEKIIELYNLGLRTIRFNMSHIDYDINEIINMVNKIENDTGNRIQTLLDTRGAEIRLLINESKEIKKGEILILGKDFDLSVQYNKTLKIGDILKIDDGKIELKIIKKQNEFFHCISLTSGKLKKGAGVFSNKLCAQLSFLSNHDLEDIHFAFSNNFDWIALSFVKSKEDLEEILNIKKMYPNSHTKIMSKIETQDAVDNLDDIISLSDGIMVARGDLGVAFPIYKIAMLQKYICEKTKAAGKLVVVGTGLLRSMKKSNIPERSEIVDLYYTFMNTSTIMFSGETAIADDPASILKMANQVYDSIHQK